MLPSPVLIVDDDPFVRQVILAALAGAGITSVRACASGEEALAVLGEMRPALILMDFILPGLDGAAVWQAMRARLGPPLPGVIYLTARTEKPPPAPGVLGALNKPFNPATLVAALEDLCGAKNHASGDGVDRLAGVRAEFLRALPAAAAVIAAHQAALSEVWRPEAAAALLAQAHTLAGSAGLFGRHALGTAAAEVEGQLIKYRKLSRAPDVQETHALQQAITALTAACRD